MQICTYNVFGLKGFPLQEAAEEIGDPGDGENSAHFIRVFNELACDVLALQEGVAVETMQQIAREMGLYLATFPSPLNWPGHVLARYPIVESRIFSHAIPGEEMPVFCRTAGAALLEVDGSRMLWVVDVHLSPGEMGLALRPREADLLQNRLEGLLAVTDHLVVLGDFNSQVDEKVHQLLKGMGFANAMEAVGGGLQATVDTSGKKGNPIDHIYFSPALKPHLKTATVVRRPGFRHDGPQEAGVWVHSDHLPVVAQLDWP